MPSNKQISAETDNFLNFVHHLSGEEQSVFSRVVEKVEKEPEEDSTQKLIKAVNEIGYQEAVNSVKNMTPQEALQELHEIANNRKK